MQVLVPTAWQSNATDAAFSRQIVSVFFDSTTIEPDPVPVIVTCTGPLPVFDTVVHESEPGMPLTTVTSALAASDVVAGPAIVRPPATSPVEEPAKAGAAKPVASATAENARMRFT